MKKKLRRFLIRIFKKILKFVQEIRRQHLYYHRWPRLYKKYSQRPIDEKKVVLAYAGHYKQMPDNLVAIKEYLENGTFTPDPTAEERMKILLHHAELIIENKGEKKGMAEARKHAAWYMKGMKNAASFRNRCGEIDSMESLKKLIEEALSE